MNTVLATTDRRHEHPPHSPVHQNRRVGLLDRAALHLGVALITWGRRPLAVDSRDELAARAERHRARLSREQAAEQWIHLNLPRH